MTFKNKIDDLFMEMVKASLEEKKSVKDEDASNDQSDDGDGMDKVDPKAVKKKFKNRKDKDIDNDGDVDDSDEYLHKRRKAISKAVANEEFDAIVEEELQENAKHKKAIEKAHKFFVKSSKGRSERIQEKNRFAAMEMLKKDLEKMGASEKDMMKAFGDLDKHIMQVMDESIAGAIIGGLGGAMLGKAAQGAAANAAGAIAKKAGASFLKRTAARAAAAKYAPAAGAAIGAVAGHQATKKKKNEGLDESEVEEGKRGFIMAAKTAKEKGEKTFMFAGKEYNCEDYDDEGNLKEFHAPGMAPKGRAKAKPSSTKKSLSDIRNKADNFKKKVKESVELEEESKTIAKVKEIVAKKSAMKIDGVMVDMFTASAIAQIYDKVNDANKKKMDGLKITKLADVAMKLMKREQLEEGAKQDGAKAARDGKKYSENPHPKGSKDHLEWSKGHNSARARKMGMREEKQECPQCEGKGCDHCDGKGYHESDNVQEKKNYEIKGGKIHISKKDFRKVHKDYKNTTKGKERMMAMDPKTGGSASYEVVFTESNFRETFRNSVSKRLSESSKNEEKSDEVANRYNELKQLAPVELTKLYMKHHEDADMDSVKKMDKSKMISAIIEKEMGGDDSEENSED